MEGWTPVPATRRMRFGAAASSPPVCPCGSRLRCQAVVRTTQVRAQAKSAGRAQANRALGRAGTSEAWFRLIVPWDESIRNPARLIAGPRPISSTVGALAPLPQPASQGPS